MCCKDKAASYGGVSKLNHWLIGIMIIGLLASGIIAVDMPKGPDKAALFGLHKSFGVLVLALGLWRIVWRLRMGFPKAAETVKKWEVSLSHALHGILMLMGLILPISGLVMAAAKGYPTAVFNLFTITPFIAKDEALGKLANAIHGYGGYFLIALITLHVLAGLKHHFINKDNTLKRMING